MTRKMSPERKRRERIRRRDRRHYTKRLVCAVCGEIAETQIHHWYYSDVYDERSMIEVCNECHKPLDAVTAASHKVVKSESINVSWVAN